MKTYRLTKGIIVLALAALPFAFGGCGKDDAGNNTNTPDIPKHNIVLVYGFDFTTDWQNIDLDTISKYNADPNVDSIFMVPEIYDQFLLLNSNQLGTYVVPKLRERHNVNPNKVFGKGDLKLNDLVIYHPEIVRFFQDTLRYNVIY